MITTNVDKIRAQIKLHGKTQTEVAKVLGVLPTNLTRTINNSRITLADLNKLAEATGCNVVDFFMSDYTLPQPLALTCPHCGKPIKVHVESKVTIPYSTMTATFRI